MIKFPLFSLCSLTDTPHATPGGLATLICAFMGINNVRILVHMVVYDSGEVSLEHRLLSWYPSQRGTRAPPGGGGVELGTRNDVAGVPRHLTQPAPLRTTIGP